MGTAENTRQNKMRIGGGVFALVAFSIALVFLLGAIDPSLEGWFGKLYIYVVLPIQIGLQLPILFMGIGALRGKRGFVAGSATAYLALQAGLFILGTCSVVTTSLEMSQHGIDWIIGSEVIVPLLCTVINIAAAAVFLVLFHRSRRAASPPGTALKALPGILMLASAAIVTILNPEHALSISSSSWLLPLLGQLLSLAACYCEGLAFLLIGLSGMLEAPAAAQGEADPPDAPGPDDAQPATTAMSGAPGAQQPRYCIGCGRPLAPEEKFCRVCGTKTQ